MSSKGGGGFNEIRFEDKKDNEEVFIHAQKDLDIRVVKDRLEWIGQDRHLMVVRDKLEDVQRDSHVNIARDQVEKFGRDHHLEVAGKEAIKITGSHSLDVTGDVIEEFKANHSSQVTQNLYLKAMQVVIEASTGLTLKVGSNFITIDMSGIAIKGMPMVQINSAGAALSGSPGSLVSPHQSDGADRGRESRSREDHDARLLFGLHADPDGARDTGGGGRGSSPEEVGGVQCPDAQSCRGREPGQDALDRDRTAGRGGKADHRRAL